MLTIITGQPGAGKTLLLVDEVRRIQAESGRPVYYHNINGLSPDLGWQELGEFRDWYDCPEGSLILFDEAWKEFPAVKTGADRPEWVQQFATHRHRGFDIYMTMQHATQLDTFPRKMAGRHLHVRRAFGMQRATVYEWPETQDPANYHALKSAKKRQFKYPSEVFDLYKSAEIHTVQRKVPWKTLAFIGGGSAAAVLLGVVAVAVLTGGEEVPVSEPAPAVEAPAGAPAQGVTLRITTLDTGTGPRGRAGLYDASVWQPEIQGLPYTSLFFDDLIEPVTFPKPSCMYIVKHHPDGRDEVDCRCVTQQMTRIDMRREQCIYIADNGWFDFTESDDPGSEGEEPAQTAPVSPAPVLTEGLSGL